jgi:hypothetical protein
MEVGLAVSDSALALCALLGTLLIPFLMLYQILRSKRREVSINPTGLTRLSLTRGLRPL